MADPEIQGGLSTEMPSTAANAIQGAAQDYTSGAQVTSGKNSQFNLGKYNLDPTQTAELLANMQEMIDQRTGGWNQFMSGLKDAAAWAVPGISGQKALALQARDTAKREEMQDVFKMRSDMASLRSAQKQAEAQSKLFDQVTGGGAGGAGGAGGTGGLSQEDWNYINSFATKAEKIAAWQDRMKVRSTERSKLENQPGYFDQKNYDVPGIGGVMMNIPEYETWRRTGYTPDGTYAPPRDFKAPTTGLQKAAEKAPQLQSDFAKLVERTEGSPEGSVSPKGATTTMQVMPGTARAPGYGVRPAADNSPEEVKRVGNDYADAMYKRYKGDKEAALIAYNAGPVVADKFLASGRDPAVLTKETIDYLARANAIQNEKPVQVASASTGTTTDAQPPVRRKGESTEAFKQRQELFKKQAETDIETAAKSAAESRKKSGDMIAAIQENAKNANEVIRTADRVITHAMNHPKEFGYAHQQENKALAGMAGFPGVGSVVEKVVPALFGAPGESDRRTQTDTDASKLGLDFAAQMFAGTGARLGVGLEQMAANAKGVGTNLPASTNALNANLVKVAAEKGRDIAASWNTWKETHGGENADPYKFMQSPEYKTLEEKWDKKLVEFDAKLKKQFPDVYQAYEEAPKKDRKPLGDIFGGKK